MVTVVSQYPVEFARWRELSIDQFFEIVRLRYAVYALEQRVDAEDFDAVDLAPTTEHWWIRDDDESLIAYLRLLTPPAGEPYPPKLSPATWAVGRMVVRQDRRRKGLAQHLLRAALDAHPNESFVLHAQAYTKSLYEKLGFTVFGQPFDEAGIAQGRMYRSWRRTAPLCIVALMPLALVTGAVSAFSAQF